MHGWYSCSILHSFYKYVLSTYYVAHVITIYWWGFFQFHIKINMTQNSLKINVWAPVTGKCSDGSSFQLDLIQRLNKVRQITHSLAVYFLFCFPWFLHHPPLLPRWLPAAARQFLHPMISSRILRFTVIGPIGSYGHFWASTVTRKGTQWLVKPRSCVSALEPRL